MIEKLEHERLLDAAGTGQGCEAAVYVVIYVP